MIFSGFSFGIGLVSAITSFVVVDAVWSTWSTWSPCSASCGYGVRTRERTCMFDTCQGPAEMHEACMVTNCTDEGDNKLTKEWTIWGEWTECTRTCGGGTRTRTRLCSTGNVTDCCKHSDTESCLLEHTQSRECINNDCYGDNKLTNGWAIWGEWTECTRTCGGGTRTRTRSCSTDNVTDCCVHTDTDSCLLEHTQSRECINNDCYGIWSDWRPWGSCSKLCGEGIQNRTRDCEPEGSHCIGGGEQTRTCYIQCPESETLISDMDEAKSCEENNPCKHNGICATNGDHVTCICTGDWRGRYCSNMCLYSSDREACTNKRGIFYDCANCNRFIICSRTGSLISMTCTPDRMWNGNGCSLANETRILCIENSNV